MHFISKKKREVTLELIDYISSQIVARQVLGRLQDPGKGSPRSKLFPLG